MCIWVENDIWLFDEIPLIPLILTSQIPTSLGRMGEEAWVLCTTWESI